MKDVVRSPYHSIDLGWNREVPKCIGDPRVLRGDFSSVAGKRDDVMAYRGEMGAESGSDEASTAKNNDPSHPVAP